MADSYETTSKPQLCHDNSAVIRCKDSIQQCVYRTIECDFLLFGDVVVIVVTEFAKKKGNGV